MTRIAMTDDGLMLDLDFAHLGYRDLLRTATLIVNAIKDGLDSEDAQIALCKVLREIGVRNPQALELVA